jgi:Uma2 family endonuclease
MTADQLLRLRADGSRYELLHGELRKMPPSGFEHGHVTMNIGHSLNAHVTAHDLGVVCAAETGFKLASNPDHVRAPDVAFVDRNRVKAAGMVEGFWAGAPDLAVQVMSPSDSYSDVEEKVIDWLAAGTRMVVVANPKKRTATVYRSATQIVILSEDQLLDGADVVPGWSIRVKDIFD